MPISIFISYARTDMKFVDQLEADLQMRSFKTWVDRRKLEGGRNWLDDIQQAIEQCEVMLVALSPDAVRSEYVRMEYRYAFSREKLVIPMLYRPCSQVPIDLNNIHWIDFTQLYSKGLSDLLAELAHIEKTSLKTQSISSLLTRTPLVSEENEPDLVAPQPAPPSPGLGSDELYLEGLKARSDGDLERAVAIWQQIFDRDPNFKDGTFASQREKLLEKLHPQRVARLRDIAEEASKAGQWEREISAWEALLKLDPDNKQGQRRLNLARKHQKYAWHYENALQFMQQKQLSLAKTELEMLWDEVPYYGDPANLAQQLTMQYQGLPEYYDEDVERQEEQARQQIEREVKIKTIRGFVELKLKTNSFLIWTALFCLLSGTSSAIGMLTHSWFWSTGIVVAVMLLAYTLGYRRAVHLLIVICITVLSGTIAFGLADYGSTFATTQHVLTGGALFWDGRQLNSGLIIGIISSIFWSLTPVVNDDFDFQDILAMGGIVGVITALIVWGVASLILINLGFGFVPGWYIAWIGLAVGVASGAGLSSLLVVCSKAFNLY